MFTLFAFVSTYQYKRMLNQHIHTVARITEFVRFRLYTSTSLSCFRIQTVAPILSALLCICGCSSSSSLLLLFFFSSAVLAVCVVYCHCYCYYYCAYYILYIVDSNTLCSVWLLLLSFDSFIYASYRSSFQFWRFRLTFEIKFFWNKENRFTHISWTLNGKEHTCCIRIKSSMSQNSLFEPHFTLNQTFSHVKLRITHRLIWLKLTAS